jgi:hypothetical protein
MNPLTVSWRYFKFKRTRCACCKKVFWFTKDKFREEKVSTAETIQKWTTIEERLPTIDDANADNCVLAIHKACKKRYFHWRTVVDNPFDFTHWMSVPDDPL